MKNILALLTFCVKYHGWHSLAKDRSTINAATSLIKKGYLELNKYRQVKYTGKIWC